MNKIWALWFVAVVACGGGESPPQDAAVDGDIAVDSPTQITSCDEVCAFDDLDDATCVLTGAQCSCDAGTCRWTRFPLRCDEVAGCGEVPLSECEILDNQTLCLCTTPDALPAPVKCVK